MSNKEQIIKFIFSRNKTKTQDIVDKFHISRQFASRIINSLVDEEKLIKIGSTKNAFYILPELKGEYGMEIKKRLINNNLDETHVLDEIEKDLPFFKDLNENIISIFDFAFTEMLNNAIEHSRSKNIEIEVILENNNLKFIVNDSGIGAFYSVMKKKKLKTELEAIQDILKGKTTTKPKAHSGEGIFFTSKISDLFILESSYYKLRIDTKIPDVFIEKLKHKEKGTKVTFEINSKSKKHLSDLFRKYQIDKKEPGFDKTEITIKLYTMGTIYVSRSQAKRVLAGLDKFKLIILDFKNVPTIGQAFADEIFRVFRNKYPDIKIKPINMNETVKFMISRVD